MRRSTKSDVPAPKALPTASVNDTAAFLREGPRLVEALKVEVPPGVRAKDATFAQQELRKLDADLGPETDVALRHLQALGAGRLSADLGPAVTMLGGLDALVLRRTESAAVLARVRSLLEYAETQQRVFDHDAVLVMEAVAGAVAYLGQFDDAMRSRYATTLDVLAARTAKAAEGRARARAAASQPTT